MADVFDIDSGSQMNYHGQREIDTYRRSQEWTRDNNMKDPRLRRDSSRVSTSLERNPGQLYDKLGVPLSPRRHSRSPSPPRREQYRRSSERNSPRRMSLDRDGWHSPQRSQPQMYSQPPLPPQNYQQTPVYQHEQHYNARYQQPAPGVPYQQNYNQMYTQQSQFNQFTNYTQPPPVYSAGHEGPPGAEYPGGWAPVTSNAGYSNITQQPPMMARPTQAPPSPAETRRDNLKKEAAIANEVKQQQATLTKQRDEYMRKASVLRRELEKLRMQKHELLSDKSPPRDSERILRENGKLQLEIQNKLKAIHNVVDMLSGIIGDDFKFKEEDIQSETSSPKVDFDRRIEPNFNYIHYDPELHWCRVCDVFPKSAKDFLTHLHSAEHRQVTQEHQLVDTPWHKLPTDEELPSIKGAQTKRVPIKGLQFFISATAWYCKLCDTWIGDLHCASLHLKSKNHSHNYSNFVEQNPHWETNWIKDREKAFERCGKLKLNEETDIPPAPEPPNIHEKRLKSKLDKAKIDSIIFETKEKKRKKKSKKRKKKDSSGSSSSSTSSDSSSEDESDRSKSIRVAMRNKMRMQAQLILKEEMEGKLEALGRLVEEDRRQKEKERQKTHEDRKLEETSKIEDNIINQWMTVNTNTNDKHILEGLKGRLKQRQVQDKERAELAAIEQRKRERQREERELHEIREREQREHQARIKAEQERELHEREERERIKERERNRRRHHSSSESPERTDRRRKRERSQERNYRKNDKYKYDDNTYESHFEKQAAESAKKDKKTVTNRKLPFIGRMPLFKKKTHEPEEKEIKKEEYELRQTKFEPVNSVKAFIPAPGVVHIPKLCSAPEINVKINAENPPPPPQIIPEPPKISDETMEEAPPPPTITCLEAEPDEIQAPPPMPETEKPKGGHLPRDFQEALNIIYPGEQRPDLAQDPSLMMQYQYNMGYGMMYPGMYDYGGEVPPLLPPEEEVLPPPPPGNHDDDLAMLGIDAGDMAAQTI